MGALHELDRAHYTIAKRELIRDFRDDLLFPNLYIYTSSPLPRLFFNAKTDEERSQYEKSLRDLLHTLVSEDNSIFRAQLYRTHGDSTVMIEVPGRQEQSRKMKRYNTWETCLLTKDFEDTLYTYIREPVGGMGARAVPIGVLAISWTTPDWQPIKDLTMRYRLVALLLVAGITLIFLIFYSVAISPLRRVSNAIEQTLRHQPVLLAKPTAQLERAYNDLARDALANRLQTELNSFIQQDVSIGISQLYDRFIYLAATLLRLPCASIQITANNGEDPQRIHRSHEYPANTGHGGSRLDQMSGVQAVSHLIRDDFEAGERHTLLLCFPSRFYRSNPEWCDETAARLAEGARRAIESLRLHDASVFRQRSEASINLAENLGHDLTNIIATTKLDLTTLQQVLELDEQDFLETPEARQIFSESVEHLLANSRFLQEIVNIYRAYTYLRRPKYETVCLNSLLDNLATLFLSSLSRQVRLDRRFDPELPPCEVEPRLIKLAFFNLLTNAVEAVKQAQAAGVEREPVITVETQYLVSRHEVALVVRDSGLGILNDRGERASPEEVEAIFRLGFTTKPESVGSGLGLSWVRSIITEFHSGRIEAANCPEGGAEFRLRFPVGIHQEDTIL